MSVMKTPRTLSPYMLIQEFLRHEPWKLLVACIMLNQTSAKQVHGIINTFFEKYHNAFELESADDEELKELIRPLGFCNRRAKTLKKMSKAWLNGFDDVLELPGIGKYAADSHRIFCEGYLVLDVQDKELKNYVRWAQEQIGRDPAGDVGSGGIQLCSETCS